MKMLNPRKNTTHGVLTPEAFLYASGVLISPCPAPGILAEELDDDITLYHPASHDVVILNSSGADVWRLAEGDLTVEGIIDTLATAYAVTADDVRSDVLRTVADLEQHGFLVECGTSDPTV
jgi:hypothetical protein